MHTRLMRCAAAAAGAIASTTLGAATPWIEWDDGDGPEAREHASVMPDPERDRAVVFAGSGYAPQLSPLADAWALDLETGDWAEIDVEGDPPAGGGSRRAAPDGGGGFLLWGGYGAGFEVSQDLQRATLRDGAIRFDQIEQRNAPPARALHAFVRDAERDRWILFGGVSSQAMYDDVWAMRLEGGVAVWERIDVERGPGERYGFAYAFDAEGDRLVVVSGAVPAQGLLCAPDAWALEFGGDTPRWTLLTGDGDAPAGRRNPLWAFDPEARTLVVTGGTADGRTVVPDVVRLDLAADPPRCASAEPAGDAEIRASGSGFFDAARGRFVLGFGNNASGVNRDLYTLDR